MIGSASKHKMAILKKILNTVPEIMKRQLQMCSLNWQFRYLIRCHKKANYQDHLRDIFNVHTLKQM